MTEYWEKLLPHVQERRIPQAAQDGEHHWAK
jgi:hypothetical protein